MKKIGVRLEDNLIRMLRDEEQELLIPIDGIEQRRNRKTLDLPKRIQLIWIGNTGTKSSLT